MLSSKSDLRISLLSTLSTSIQDSLIKKIEFEVADARNRGEPWVGSWTMDSIHGEVARGSTLVATGSADTQLRAFLCFRPPGPFWEIMLVMTLSRFRGQRLAGALIDSLFDHAEEVQTSVGSPRDVEEGSLEPIEVGLEVRADNRSAIRCYEMCGFIEQGRRKGYYSDSSFGSSNRAIDAVVMSAKRQMGKT